MVQFKAFMAKHDDIATTLIDFFNAVAIALVCIGSAPFLIWLSQF
tara:strand:- start:36 stop:170 length:135 start_codon:yes stop_codon:yes gene_type:complete